MINVKRFYLLCLLSLCSITSVLAQEITGKLTTIFGDPLIGANVIWENTDVGVITDEEGNFSISAEGVENKTLVCSYVGFKTEIVKVRDILHWEIQLIEDNKLQEVQITSKQKATRYADDPAKVEVIGVRELERAACCSLAGCFNTNAAVQAVTTNIVTDAKELRILGLAGVYNQVLFDGMPLLQGLSYTYGSGSYPGTLIETIFISKGANSVIQGYEGMSGQINIIPHTPEKSPKIYLNGFANSFGESQYNANYMLRKSNWSNLTAAHLTLPAAKTDGDGDNFSDVVQTRRFSLYNKWIYDNPENQKIRSQVGVRLWDEKRQGGEMDFDRDSHLGSSEVYGQVTDLTQFDLYAKLNYKITDDLSLTWLNSSFFHDQESHFGFKKYVAQQQNFTSDIKLDYFYGDSDNNIKIGSSIRMNRMEEEIIFPASVDFLTYDGVYNTDYDIPGFYAENTLDFSSFTLITGLRADHHKGFGWKVTPRFLIRAALSEKSDIRFSIGKGFRRAHVFSERINLLASNRDVIFEETLAPEEAVNLGLNFTHTVLINDDVQTTLSGDAYYTRFQNQIFPDYDKEVGKAFISNFYEKSVSKSFQFENKWEFFQQLDFKWSYNYLDLYREEEDVEKELPFAPKHKWMANASYSTADEQWQFDVTYTWTGRKKLPYTGAYPVQYQTEALSPSYSHLDLQFTKRWSKLEIYSGIENILDFRQEFPILAYDDPFGPYFDTAFNWGPTKGREIYLGIRYKIQ